MRETDRRVAPAPSRVGPKEPSLQVLQLEALEIVLNWVASYLFCSVLFLDRKRDEEGCVQNCTYRQTHSVCQSNPSIKTRHGACTAAPIRQSRLAR